MNKNIRTRTYLEDSHYRIYLSYCDGIYQLRIKTLHFIKSYDFVGEDYHIEDYDNTTDYCEVYLNRAESFEDISSIILDRSLAYWIDDIIDTSELSNE